MERPTCTQSQGRRRIRESQQAEIASKKETMTNHSMRQNKRRNSEEEKSVANLPEVGLEEQAEKKESRESNEKSQDHEEN